MVRLALAVLALTATLAVARPAMSPPDPGPQPAPGATPARESPPPAPDAPLPTAAADLAARYDETTRALLAAIDAWTDRARGGPPEDVALLALHQQRIVRRLADRRRLSRRVLPSIAPALRPSARDDVLARRELADIRSVVRQRPRIRIGRAQPADVLRRHYRRAWRRFRVGWPLLAAVNHVESAFGRLRNESTAGARGPMQFMPATWAAYGLGGDVRDPRDAILGAANYLRANGAPGDEARALYRYNPSRHYVSAVSRYVRMIRRDPRVFYALYSRSVFIGDRRMSGPGTK